MSGKRPSSARSRSRIVESTEPDIWFISRERRGPAYLAGADRPAAARQRGRLSTQSAAAGPADAIEDPLLRRGGLEGAVDGHGVWGTNRPIGTSSGPPGAQQPTPQQDQPGPDQQGRQPVAADRPDRASADPDHDLEEYRQHQEANQPGRDQPGATGGQVTPAAHHPHQPPTAPGTDPPPQGP